MAIATYSDLITSVGNWLHRSDLAAQIPDFITLCESRLNRLLPTRGTEADTTLTATLNSAYITLPADFNTPVALWLEAWVPRRELVFVAPTELPYMPIATYPTYWCLKKNQIQFDRLANAAFNLTLRYVQLLTLSTSSSNYVLSNYPDAYLYGTLLESAPYLRDDGRVALWQDRFDRAINEILSNENQYKSNTVLLTETAKMNRPRTFNIYEG
jgi:hypothetical protein